MTLYLCFNFQIKDLINKSYADNSGGVLNNRSDMEEIIKKCEG